jgi:PAS domain-containing protein
VRLATNPIVLRMVLVLVTAGFAFLVGLLLMRRMRRSISEEGSFSDTPSSVSASESFPLHMYHAVIQQLKQQKHELQSLQLVERRRAKTSENISAAVLSNLSSGVLFFTPNGLVRQANASAKQILGFASPVGMSAAEVFRQAELISASDGAYTSLAEAVNVSIREKKRFQRLEAQYRTPAGEERTLDITVSSVHAPDSEVLSAAGPGVAGPGVAGTGVTGTGVTGPGVACLGVACLINDRTEMTEIRRQQELRGEMSGEMALGLRSSLTTIAGYAQQLAASRDPELARQLASDIAAEAAHLDRTIGGFLAGAKAARAGSKA